MNEDKEPTEKVILLSSFVEAKKLEDARKTEEEFRKRVKAEVNSLTW